MVARESASMRFRRSLYTVKPIKSGEPISREKFRSIRPGYGLAPKHLDDIIGRKAARDIAYGERLSWGMIV
jgi:N-acetylneuraminate synthase